MSELGRVGKIMLAMEVAVKSKVGCQMNFFDVLNLYGYIKDLEDHIQLMQASNDWIPVKTKLPPDRVPVIVTVEIPGQQMVSVDDHSQGVWSRWGNKVIKWQYLPNP